RPPSPRTHSRQTEWQHGCAGGSVTGSAPADEEIIRRVLAGEVDLFVELITRYQQHVGRIVAGHVRRDMVEEVSHDVFVRAYTSLPTYSRRTPFSHCSRGSRCAV